MKKKLALVLRSTVGIGLVLVAAGCIVIKIDNSRPANCCSDHPSPPHHPPGDGEGDPEPGSDVWPAAGSYRESWMPVDPTGNSGSLTIPITSLLNGNGGQTCFPTSNGWD